jgi:hypothetical protein
LLGLPHNFVGDKFWSLSGRFNVEDLPLQEFLTKDYLLLLSSAMN